MRFLTVTVQYSSYCVFHTFACWCAFVEQTILCLPVKLSSIVIFLSVCWRQKFARKVCNKQRHAKDGDIKRAFYRSKWLSVGRFSNLDEILNVPQITRFRDNEYCFSYIIKIFNNENTLKKFNDLFKVGFSRLKVDFHCRVIFTRARFNFYVYARLFIHHLYFNLRT